MCKIETSGIPNPHNHPESLVALFLKQRLLGKNTNLPLGEAWKMMFKFRVWNDPDIPRPEECLCPAKLRQCRCANANCNRRFTPGCRGELFCCLACFLNTDFDRIAVLILHFKGNIKKLRAYLRKRRYRATENGEESRLREYARRNAKRSSAGSEVDIDNAVQGTVFKAPLDFDLDDSIASLLFGKSAPKCKRVGCSNLLDKTTINGVEKHYCSEECRNHEKEERRKARSEKSEPSCPIAAYVRLILAILRF